VVKAAIKPKQDQGESVRIFGLPIQELLAFPFRRMTLQSPLPVVHVLKRIEQEVEPRRLWRFSRTHRDFEGVVSRTNFKIMRIIHYRNSFLPIIVGTLQPRLEGGTRVEITMRLHRAVAIFMAMWEGALLAILASLLFCATRSAHGNTRLAFAVVLGMVCFGYIMCAGAFNFEARRAGDVLTKIVNTAGN
jgi:hypothetical protein